MIIFNFSQCIFSNFSCPFEPALKSIFSAWKVNFWLILASNFVYLYTFGTQLGALWLTAMFRKLSQSLFFSKFLKNSKSEKTNRKFSSWAENTGCILYTPLENRFILQQLLARCLFLDVQLLLGLFRCNTWQHYQPKNYMKLMRTNNVKAVHQCPCQQKMWNKYRRNGKPKFLLFFRFKTFSEREPYASKSIQNTL